MTTRAYAGQSATSPIAPHTLTRRKPTASDVEIEILYCGVCHSDVHQVRNEWGGTVYPCVPGHEIVGRVISVGKDVKKFKPHDLAGVGCMVDSCHACDACNAHLEQYCENGVTLTYNSSDKHTGSTPGVGPVTYGGYSEKIVVDQAFVLHISDKLDLAATAPLLCAGITTWSPMRHWKVSKGQKVGVVGLGGLGHMAVKFGHAMGAHVVVFTTSPGKKDDALRLGANEVVLSKNKDEMDAHKRSFHFIIDAVAANHDINEYLGMLKLDGTLVQVGAPADPLPVNVFNLIGGRRTFAGSLIGGVKETQEMLDFCAKHNIVCDIEKIDIKDINTAYERMIKGDVKYRFVIDMASLKK